MTPADLRNDWVSVCTVVLDGEIVPVAFPSLICTGDNPGPARFSLQEIKHKTNSLITAILLHVQENVLLLHENELAFRISP